MAGVLTQHGLQAVGGFTPLLLHVPDHDPVPEVERILEGSVASHASTLVLSSVSGRDGYACNTLSSPARRPAGASSPSSPTSSKAAEKPRGKDLPMADQSTVSGPAGVGGGVHATGEARLLATCWSSAGDAAPDRDDLRSPLSLRERIEAASAAGFTGFGLLSADLPAAEQEYGLSGIRAMLEGNGIVDLELEGIPYWWDDGEHREESDRIRHALLTAAEALGARHIKVTPDGDDGRWDPGRWASKLAELAAQAEGVGTRLGLEFFPWSNIKTLHDGLELVEAAGHDAAGVVVDAWHVARADTPASDLASVPLRRIVGVELDDADADVVGTLFEDTVHRRRYCGDGTFDLAGIITALRTAGWTGPWGVEILSAEHRGLPVREALRRAADSARKQLAARTP
jgi:sugar phosphate isomerase/epimerase